MRSYSNLSKSRIGRSMMRLFFVEKALTSATEVAFTFITPRSFDHSKTRTHVRLLGPCFKTGRMRPYDRQRRGCIVRNHRPRDRQQSRRTARSPPHSTTDREDGTLAERHAPQAPRSGPGHDERRTVTVRARESKPTFPPPLRPSPNRRWRAPARSATVGKPTRTAAVHSDPPTARLAHPPAESRTTHC